MTRKKRIAIIGGGCGGVAAAFWLSSPDLNDAFEVTLYTQGWRLGGKGASGRCATADRRIKEHGLHLWFGCYHRAFQMMRLCYGDPACPKPFKTLSDAFIPMHAFALESADGPGDPASWSPWGFSLPSQGDFPGGDKAPSLAARVGGAAAWGGGSLTRCLRRALQPSGTSGGARRRWRRMRVMMALGLAFAKGYVGDVLRHREGCVAGMTALDDVDFREWLGLHGADAAALDAAPVRALYDLAFAYPDGDTRAAGQLAASSAVGLILEMIGYRGAPFYKMASGMGDTIFAPLYRVLEARGVRIALFHRLRSVRPDTTGSGVDELTLHRQADFIDGAYAPLVSVAGAECWPDQPRWDQLKDGAALADRGVEFESSGDDTHVAVVDLRRGVDFDDVVLATPPEGLKTTTRDLNNPAWTAMLDHSASVATQAFQLWLDAPAGDLGWRGPGLVSAYAPPFSTWADMSHLLPRETWPGPGSPASLHYFCGTMPEVDARSPRPHDRARQAMQAWLGDAAVGLWPNFTQGPGGPVVESWAQANVDPSERYVQVPPGNPRHRLKPDSRVYDNLYLAGDWTRTRHCGGCVENAVQSGLTAARAISGRADLGDEGGEVRP